MIDWLRGLVEPAAALEVRTPAAQVWQTGSSACVVFKLAALAAANSRVMIVHARVIAGRESALTVRSPGCGGNRIFLCGCRVRASLAAGALHDLLLLIHGRPKPFLSATRLPFRWNSRTTLPMTQAYIVSAVRTAGGRKGGRLAGVHPVDLAAISLDAVAERVGHRSRRDRRRDHGLRDPGGRAVAPCRAQRGARLEAAAERAGGHRSTASAAPRSRRSSSPRRR